MLKTTTQEETSLRASLLDAAEVSNLSIMKSILERFPEAIKDKDMNGSTALILAAMRSQLPVVQYILERFPEAIKDTDKNGYTALIIAAIQGQLPVVQYILECFPEAIKDNDADNDGYTALICAVLQSQLPVVQYILERFPEAIKDKTKSGKRALNFAINVGDLAIIQYIQDFEKKQESDRLVQMEEAEPNATIANIPAPSSSDEVTINFRVEYADLTMGKFIGEGSYGIVYQATWHYNEVAVKQFKVSNYSEDDLKELENETAIIAQNRSSNLVQLKGICLTKPHYCLVMELMPRGSLDKWLHNAGEQIPWAVRYRIAIDIGAGLYQLHQRGILHRDLKSLNVLLSDNLRAKLCDFGLAKIKDTTRSTLLSQSKRGSNQVGTLAWMSPELFTRRAIYSTKSDVYAYGMVLWEIASRVFPFKDAPNEQILIHWIISGVQEDMPEETPPKFADLIKRCWSKEPDDRPEAKEILDELKTYMENSNS